MRHVERDKGVNEVSFFVNEPFWCYQCRYKRKKERVSGNCNYRHQIGEKFGLEKACPNEKKVNRDVDIIGVHCIYLVSPMYIEDVPVMSPKIQPVLKKYLIQL